jgi:DNA-binding NtrC family response regulator
MKIPCLNERREDIPDLATHFLGRLYRIYRSPDEPKDAVPMISDGARKLLTQHHYSGNIREMRSILQRALFLRSGRNIEAAEIRQAIGNEPPIVAADSAVEPVEKLVQQTARQIFERIIAGDDTFWSGVYQPFSENRIARDVVVQVIEQARRQGGRSMPKIALLLKVCDPHIRDEAEQKIFYKFKNFLYKTVRIT